MTQKNRARIRERERSVRRYLLTSSYGGAASLRIAEEGTPTSLDGEDHGEGQNNRHRDELQKARYLSCLCAGIEEYEQCPNWVLGPLGSSGCGLQCSDPIRKIVPNKGNRAHERRLRESPDFRRLYNRKYEILFIYS